MPRSLWKACSLASKSYPMTAEMITPESLYRLVCRPALPKDTPEVMELTRTIWDGEDYVPHVWGEWLADPQGLLAVVEFGGRVVGLGKLTQLSARDWWLEGLRVHPDFERRGIASHLNDFLLDYWLRKGAGVIRLVTASYRLPIHRICEHTGFRKVGEFTPFLAPTIELKSGGRDEISFAPVTGSQAEEGSDFVHYSPVMALSAGLMDLSWQWVTPSPEIIRQAIDHQQAYWWSDRRGMLVISEDNERSPRTSMIRLLACQNEDLAEMLQDFRKLAGQLGFHQAGWVAPLQPAIEPLLNQAGFQRDWDASLFVFEKHHPKS